MIEAQFPLDTNVVSELARPRPDARVVTFIAGATRFAVSVMLFHKLQYGCEILSDPAQQVRLTRFATEMRDRFAPEALPITLEGSPTWKASTIGAGCTRAWGTGCPTRRSSERQK